MTIDIKTLNVEQRRNTFGHVARRLGADKAASRYEEGTYDVQATANFHYKPLWDADHWTYDQSRTKIQLKDWYLLIDPRQYYYATYTMARANQSQANTRNFEFVEKRNQLALLDSSWRDTVAFYLLPLRHVEWGANMNCGTMCDHGYGTAVTASCLFSATDHLAMAQIIGRIGLALDGNTGVSLQAAKERWMEAEEWQELRRLVEDSLVVEDWFELMVAQNLALDGLLYPLVYSLFDAEGQSHGGSGLSMLTEFMAEWFTEHSRWVDQVIKLTAAESPENKDLISGWLSKWSSAAATALLPLSIRVLGHQKGAAAIETVTAAVKKRAQSLGLDV